MHGAADIVGPNFSGRLPDHAAMKPSNTAGSDKGLFLHRLDGERALRELSTRREDYCWLARCPTEMPRYQCKRRNRGVEEDGDRNLNFLEFGIGRASCRERVGQYVYMAGGAVHLKTTSATCTM